MPVKAGDVRSIRMGDECPCQYDACNEQATMEYLVEMDSMGADWLPLCEVHVVQFKADVEAGGPTIAACEWCRTTEVEVFPFRDWEDGGNGPVYEVCNACIRKNNDAAHEELKLMEDREDAEQARELGEFEEMPEMAELEEEDVLNLYAGGSRSLMADFEGDTYSHGLLFGMNSSFQLDPRKVHFNLSGPTFKHNHIGFVAAWQDGLRIVCALDIHTGQLLFRGVANSMMEIDFIASSRYEEMGARIRALGYPVKRMQDI